LKFFLMLMLFIIFSPIFPWFSLKLGIVLYLCLSSILIYTIIFSGWGSKSKYSFLGRLRGGAQIISYEIGLLTLIFFPTCLANSFKVKEIKNKFSFSIILYVIIFFFWIITIVAETNRSPFDFAEGERELVSGFNTEYKRMGFALLFLGEYGNIIFLSFFTRFVFFKKRKFTRMLVPILILFLFLLFRGTFPRFRYDFLMNLVWKILLPLSLILLWLIFIF
jgi:NADH-ubiquinone oxidoreductase chain 1